MSTENQLHPVSSHDGPEATIKNGMVVVGPDGKKFRIVQVVSNTERNRRKRRRQKLRGSRKGSRRRRAS
ncbi:MAG: hypothetical protein GY854_21710 [Deltaproteobacteria bacterium]|nr:hypothetical protein [Deltaproteobacteria bacterium]